MSDLTDKEIADECEKIRDEDGWPLWPVLPMKNRKDRRLGIMIGGGDLAVVFLMNLFELHGGDLDSQVRDRPRESFDCTEKLVAAGWMGD